MSSRVTVLLLGAGKRVSLAREIRSSGLRFGLDVDLLSYEGSTDVPIANEADIILGHKFRDQSCPSHLAEVCAQHRVAIVIACHDQAVRLLLGLPEEVFAPSCPIELIDTFGSKIRSASYFRGAGMNVAPLPTGAPAIAKPDTGSASKGLLYLRTDADFARFAEMPNRDQYELQALMSGPEFTVDAYRSIRTGEVVAAQRVRLETSGGEVVRTATVSEAEIARQVSLLFSDRSVVGPVTVQFIWDHDLSSFFVMEVNPRFGGGMPASIAAGFPIVDGLFADFLGVDAPRVIASQNVVVARSHREHVFQRPTPYDWRHGE